MISKQQSPFMADMIHELVRTYDCSRKTPMVATGPKLLSDRVGSTERGRLNLSVRVLEPSVFYPIDWSSHEWRAVDQHTRNTYNATWNDPAYLLSEGLIQNTSFAVTFWTHSWGRE